MCIRDRYVMYTDASEYAIGVVLHQEDEQGGLRVVAYANRTLKGAELDYCTSEKEILAIINALRKFRHYLYGTHFEIHTDNQEMCIRDRSDTGTTTQTSEAETVRDPVANVKHYHRTKNVPKGASKKDAQ